MVTNILNLLKITPSDRSIDYVKNKKQFQLHTLLTEQRHRKTWNLSFTIKENIIEGLKMIFSVDEDISHKFKEITKDTSLIEQAVESVVKAIKENKKIYIYGCGATGRLAKQMESAVWRPFWKKIKKYHLWNKLKSYLPENIEENIIGEMTGGDRALISSLEGFEDLQLIGKLQLIDHGIQRGDVVFCITEGGETSSVIGTILAALEQYTNLDEAREHLYFIYNNPDEVLLPFERSKKVINSPGITKINLTTGPQAITGSTRMQATTSETYLMGIILEEAIYRILKNYLTQDELKQLGFSQDFSIKDRLLYFDKIRDCILNSIDSIAEFTYLEAQTYKNQRYSTYFAKKALITVFIDCAERSPTFYLFPLDTVNEKTRKCWVQVWTEGENYKEAWQNFLGRNFCGLKEDFYKSHFLTEIEDPYLKEAALRSLSNAGDEQEKIYDFSFSEKQIKTRGPNKGDLGVLICVDEEIDELLNPDSNEYKFATIFKTKDANLCIILVSDRELQDIKRMIPSMSQNDVVVNIKLDKVDDPLNLKRQIVLKMLLNAHSTGVMAMIGRVVGNTMTNVNPSNLKLIGRATYLIMNHVNDVIMQTEWKNKYGETEPITYTEANAVLFDAISFVANYSMQVSEVALSIVRILEGLGKKEYVSWEDTLKIIETEGLENYLKKHNPALRCEPVR